MQPEGARLGGVGGAEFLKLEGRRVQEDQQGFLWVESGWVLRPRSWLFFPRGHTVGWYPVTPRKEFRTCEGQKALSKDKFFG